jgi:hypothetical protein
MQCMFHTIVATWSDFYNIGFATHTKALLLMMERQEIPGALASEVSSMEHFT